MISPRFSRKKKAAESSEPNGDTRPMELRQEIKSALESMSSSRMALQSTKRATLKQVNSQFDTLTEVLEQERKYFIDCINRSFLEQDDLLSSKQSELSEAFGKITKSISLSVKSTLHGADDKKEKSQESFHKPSIQPVMLPEMESEICSPSDFQDFCRAKNFQYVKSDPLKCHSDRDLDLSLAVRETLEVNLHIDPQGIRRGGKLELSTKLVSCHDDSSQTLCLKKVTNEKYSLSLTPQKQGKHHLVIKHNDAHVCASPLPVFVTIPPSQLKRLSSKKLAGEITGLKAHKGNLYACMTSKVIEVLDPKCLAVDLSIRVSGVSDIAFNSLHIFGTDKKDNQLIKMNMNGTSMASTGVHGEEPGQFSSPNSIRIGKDDKLYICDTNNHRIQVFDKDLKFVRGIGSKGSANGCFNFPSDLDFDRDGNIYVADEKNSRIQVLSPQGRHIRNIGPRAVHPVSVAVWREMVYVADWDGHYVSVFKTGGEFVTKFGEGTLFYPKCIAIDENGFVYVSDSRSTVVKF